MSTYYNFYTEAKIGDTWYCIDPRFLRLERGSTPMTYRIHNTYWNGSRSYFGEAYDRLEEVSHSIKLEDTSAEFRMLKILDWQGDDGEVAKYYDQVLRVLPFQKLRELYEESKTYENYGIYSVGDIAKYEQGVIEDLYDREIDPEKYSSLVDDARKMYKYYEWNYPMSWQANIPKLMERVVARINEFEDVNCLECDDVRILMYWD